MNSARGLFQLDPESIAARARTGGASVRAPSLFASILRGSVGFTVVSVAGFAPWAVWGGPLHHALGEAGLYALCAVVFIGLSGLLLHGLIIGPGSLPRFYKLFGIAFIPYAVAWTLGWMLLRGHTGGIVGLLAGTALMGTILAYAFAAPTAALKIIPALFLLNAAGYFGGGWVESHGQFSGHAQAGLAWGVCYGAGLGAGLGIAFYVCQTQARELVNGIALE